MSTCSLFSLISGYGETQLLQGDQKMAQAKKALVLAKVAGIALDTFVNKNIYLNFDPHVGETACQLRALKLLSLLNDFDRVKEEIVKERKKIGLVYENLLENLRKGTSHKETLAQFCGNRDLTFGSDLSFLVESFLLTKAKSTKKEEDFFSFDDKTNYSCLKQFLQDVEVPKRWIPGVKQLEQIGKFTQVDLAHRSVVMIQEAAFGLTRICVQEALQLVRKDRYGRECVPLFYTMETLIAKVLSEEQMLLLDIKVGSSPTNSMKRIQQLFGPNVEQTDFQKLETISQGPVIVITGYAVDEQLTQDTIVEYIEKFSSYSLIEILLINDAYHVQYPAGIESDLPEDRQFQDFKARALDEGFCRENPTTFVIDHIYCALVEEVWDNGE